MSRARGRAASTPTTWCASDLEEIEPEDVQMLRESLNLSEVAADAAYSLQRKLGARGWLKSFLEASQAEKRYAISRRKTST